MHRYVTEIDLTRLPTGARGWAALVAWAAASDDCLERYFLELKSDVDLNTKDGQHKVAKFILGAANRDPAKATKRFGGHAVMLLGIGGGKATGIAPFEAKDLEHEVVKFTGTDGPGWDFERIRIDDDHDVIAIVAAPPTGGIYPSMADGRDLYTGDVYLRGDGKTAKATGAELQAMLARLVAARTSSTLPDITVEVLGTAMVVHYDPARLTTWVEETEADYLNSLTPRKPTSPLGDFGFGSINADRRSAEEFRGEVEEWSATALADPASGLHELASKLAGSVRLRLTNPVKTPLRDVQVSLEFDSPVRALYWEDRYKKHERAELFPDRPIGWGQASIAGLLSPHIIPPYTAPDTAGQLQITAHSPAQLSLDLNLLRPKATHVSDDEDVVLVLFVDTDFIGPITGRWSLTAGDVHDVLEGELTVDYEYRDWTKAIANVMGDEIDRADR